MPRRLPVVGGESTDFSMNPHTLVGVKSPLHSLTGKKLSSVISPGRLCNIDQR
jgi:hypothetical protein